MIGHLDQRVSIQRQQQQAFDSIGQPIDAWVTLCTVWAAVEPLSGREYFAASAAQSEITTKVTMRYRPGITSADRLIHDGKLYNIKSVIDTKSAHRTLQLMCVG